MKIDSLNSMWYGGPEYHRLQKADEKAGSPSANPSESTVKTSFSHILEKSQQLVTDDTAAVEEARRALEAGELDRPEAIRDAAATILRQGI